MDDFKKSISQFYARIPLQESHESKPNQDRQNMRNQLEENDRRGAAAIYAAVKKSTKKKKSIDWSNS